MTTIGKIFVVVNFLLSVFFVGVAATVLHKSNDYRELYETAQADMKTAQDEWSLEKAEFQEKNSELDKDRTSLRTEKENLNGDKTRITQERDQLRNDIREINATKDRMSSTVDDMRTQLNEAQDYVKSIQGDKDKAVNDMNSAMGQKRTAENEQARLNDLLEEEKAQVAELEQRIASLDGELEQWNLINEYWAKERSVDLKQSLVAAPPINGQVSQVNGELGFVILSVGSNDNVKVGYQFVVSRGSSYIADVIVDTVEDNISSARIKFTKPGGAIRVSDAVTTRL